MGQTQTFPVGDLYAPDGDVAPGTYRIVHDGTDKALQIHKENRHMIVLQRRQSEVSDSDQDDDHWFILRSGDGFIFKHCREKTYLTGPWSTGSGPQPTRATRYPTTWAIHTKKGSDDIKCVITIAMDRDEYWTGEHVGLVGEVSQRGVCFSRLSETEEHDQIWRLERIGDATVEEDSVHRVQELERELQAVNARWTAGESTLKAMLHELDNKEVRLETVRCELSTQAMELDAVRDELSQQAAELKQKYKALDEIRELLDAKERALSEKDRGIFENNVIIREKVQEISQGEERPQSLEAAEADLKEQVTESTIQQPQRGDTNNASMTNATVQRPIPESASKPEIRIQTILSLPAAPPVEQRLAELGWSFD